MNTMHITLKMPHNYKKQRLLRKVRIGISVFIIIWISFGLFLTLHRNTSDKLKEIGYNNKEISVITDLLDKKTTILYNYTYFPNITDLLFAKDFQEEKLDNYLTYYQTYPHITLENMLFMVNNQLTDIPYSDFIKELITHQNCNLELISRYNDYYKTYELDVDDVILAVNNDLDLYNLKIQKDDYPFIEEEYFRADNLERYREYYHQNMNLSAKEIVTRINHNLDKKAYQDTRKALTNTFQTLVNRYYYLEKDYVPNNLVTIAKENGSGKLTKEAYDAFNLMNDAAKEDKLNLYIVTGYVSYADQKKLYNNYLNKYGRQKADERYERPGYSEHQAGYTISLATSKDKKVANFHLYDEAKWMEKNAYKYGFILRYPKDKKAYTGYNRDYQYRYVGIDIATYIYEHKITLEEYYEYFLKKEKES